MEEDIDTVNINDKSFSIVKRLTPGVFTERNLYRNNSDNNLVVIKEPSILFQKVLEDASEALLDSFNKNSSFSHSCYLKPTSYQYFKDKKTCLVASEYRRYNLLSLHQYFSTNTVVSLNLLKHYIRKLTQTLDALCDSNIYYYTLRVDDIFLDEDLNIYIDEFTIGHAIISSSPENLSTWVEKINIKSGTIAPEFFLNWEDKMSCQEKSVVFNLGYILFSLLVGNPPFIKMDDRYYRMIIEGRFDEFWKVHDAKGVVDENARSLLEVMLSDKPFNRPSLGQVLESKFLAESGEKNDTESSLRHEFKNIIELMNSDASKNHCTIAKKKGRGAGKDSASKVCRSFNSNESNREDEQAKLNERIKDFLEHEEKTYLHDYFDSGNSRFVAFFNENNLEEVVRQIACFFSLDGNHKVSFLKESILGLRLEETISTSSSNLLIDQLGEVNGTSIVSPTTKSPDKSSQVSYSSDKTMNLKQSSNEPSQTFEVRFYEDKTSSQDQETIVAEFININTRDFLELFESFLRDCESEF